MFPTEFVLFLRFWGLCPGIAMKERVDGGSAGLLSGMGFEGKTLLL